MRMEVTSAVQGGGASDWEGGQAGGAATGVLKLRELGYCVAGDFKS